ncbi:hypothetical protein RHGRI_031767 [Rhododendron griersonianum]|uniref:Transcriptional corepressor SEUSS n=1 Tax=Rhododendron griersonianum TaxID=479676 RepID=A0AAV6IEV8_9ERIC|nr:hypothetical protein RHGRI_031767 [Rhododendron griersonianum]
MVPTGPSSTQMGGPHSQPVPPSLLRSNSGLMGGGQGGSNSLASPRTQFTNMNMLGNVSNGSSLLPQSFGTIGPNSGFSGAESDANPTLGNGMGFTSSPPSFAPSNMANPSSSVEVQGQQFPSGSQMLPDQQQSQQLQQLHSLRNLGPVKLEPQQIQTMRNLGPVKMEPQHSDQQIQTMRSLAPVKMEPQHSDQSLFLHQQQQHHHQQQQQQQQQLLHMSRQSQAAAPPLNLLNQQRILHLQQQHQQQLALKSLPLQRSPSQQLFQTQNLPLRSPAKPVYEPGMCARRLTRYMYEQQHRPEDNNIEFWRKFVAEYFAPNAKKKWCVSLYGSGRQTTGVFPQDVWHCEICNRKPGRGFEATVEVLPRLFKIKYESGTLEELLYVDMPREYQNSSGQIVLDYAKAIQESVFDQLRVVRDGQLRIVFSLDLKICSWEFCARRHEELIPRRLLIPQVTQLGIAAQKYQASTQNASSNLSVPELQSNCNMRGCSQDLLVLPIHRWCWKNSGQIGEDDHEVIKGNLMHWDSIYGKTRHIDNMNFPCFFGVTLQISEVVNSMKDLIDYSRETGTGPMESLANFPRRTNTTSGFHGQPQQTEEQLRQQHQTVGQILNNDQTSVQDTSMQVATTNGVPSANNPLNLPSNPSSTSSVVGLLHQNSMNSRQQNPTNNPANSPNIPVQQPALSGDADPNDSHSSVQKIIQEMMMTSQLNDVKNVNGILTRNNSMGLNGGVVDGNVGMAGGFGGGIGGGGGGIGQAAMINGLRAAMGNNSMIMNGRVGMTSMSRDQNMNHQQQALGDQLISGLGAVNGFNNLPFDWKSSP